MSCTEQKVDICPEESADALLKQCQDRKWQGTLLRVATLLLLLSCMLLALFSYSTAFGRSRQQNEPGQSLQNMHMHNMQNMHIHLVLNINKGSDDCKHLRWNTHFNSSLTYENSSIMVPKTGVYFVYVRFILGCEENNTDFQIKFESWNEAYPNLRYLTKAEWSLTCSSSHTVFIGELFELYKGDQLKVKVEKGCEVIRGSRFGAFSQ